MTDVADLSLLELFRGEVEGQLQTLSQRLLALEQQGHDDASLEALMRAAHSIKGAARMVDVEPVIRLAHAMEDCFAAAQRYAMVLDGAAVDVLLRAGDLIGRAAADDGGAAAGEVAAMVAEMTRLKGADAQPAATAPPAPPVGCAPAGDAAAGVVPSVLTEPAPAARAGGPGDAGARAVRVSAASMDAILGLAGEALVESRGLWRQVAEMQRLKDRVYAAARRLDAAAGALEEGRDHAHCLALLRESGREFAGCRDVIAERTEALTAFSYRSGELSERLHNELIASRMRPFADGIEGLQRMVRDLARELGKQAVLEIDGAGTPVDREVLERIKVPLQHLLRNAVDHGIEPPQQRLAAGKPAQGRIRLEACHRAGMLSITVEDDGAGIDLERLRRRVVERGLADGGMAAVMSDAELLEFIFLPGFTTRDTITEVSGRGVGMDVVQDMVREIRGAVSASTRPGKGATVHMQLPLTLSVIRALLVEVAGDCFAVPLVRIDRALRFPAGAVETVENRQYFTLEDGRHIGLVTAAQILADDPPEVHRDELCVVVVSDRSSRYGIVVDRFLEERELAVRVLDPRLGKLRDIGAAAFMDDGRPLLIVDVDDLVRSIDKVAGDDRLRGVQTVAAARPARPRILVVDDSITVREVERKLLQAAGYDVDVAVDGMDGWNAVRDGDFALVITDVDMPRMDGIELVRLIKQDRELKHIPVMIVSYKDREDDRHRGLEAGADYYLTKGSFHDDTLREAVTDLIGAP